jgi:3-mercaptopyruvate sulfurtransferase SseA
MQSISREELHEGLARGDRFKLVMTLPPHAFATKHIPGSLLASTRAELEGLDPGDDIVVYCAGTPCPASIWAYHFLVGRGHSRVRRFPGGIADWEAAGYPVDGAEASTEPRRDTRRGRRPERRRFGSRRSCIPFRAAIV